MTTAVRLPVEPLFQVLGANVAVAEDRRGQQGVPSPVSHVARHVGVRPRTVHRWVADGGLPIDVADRVAVAAGLHPGEVWAEWWALPDPDPVAAAFRALRTRREYARRAARAAKRRRAELVRQYTRVERARARWSA